jgi:hypothetical protein
MFVNYSYAINIIKYIHNQINKYVIVDYLDPVKFVVADIKADKKIFDMASIILKIEQSIEPKFLRRPLGTYK